MFNSLSKDWNLEIDASTMFFLIRERLLGAKIDLIPAHHWLMGYQWLNLEIQKEGFIQIIAISCFPLKEHLVLKTKKSKQINSAPIHEEGVPGRNVGVFVKENVSFGWYSNSSMSRAVDYLLILLTMAWLKCYSFMK